MPTSSKEAATVALEGSDEEVSALLASLRADPTHARRVLDDLSKDSRPEVRSWVPWAATRIFKQEAVPYLLALAHDRDSDVSDGALGDLLDLDPTAAITLVERIRKKLLASDPQESVFAMWSLARLRDRGSIDAIRPLLNRSDFPFQQRVAEVVLLALEGKSDVILGRLRKHDHDYTSALAYAALIAGGEEGVRTVEDCAENAPDSACRHHCEWHLSKYRERAANRPRVD